MAAGNAIQTTPVEITYARFHALLYYTNHANTILIPVRVLLHGVYYLTINETNNCCVLGTFPEISQFLGG